MALTNLASVGEDIQVKIVQDGGWNDLSNMLASDNVRVQCAAVECMTNLILCPPIVERLEKEEGDQDLKLLLMFCGRRHEMTGAFPIVAHG